MGFGPDSTVLVGRQRERVLLERALENARSGVGGSATVLRGEAGIGKTALLDWTAARAARAPFTVLRAAGDESAVGIAFGALHQILRPLRESSRALSPHQRDALEGALGLQEGVPPNGFTVGACVLTLLAEAARRQPVLIMVDDLHWADSSSAAVFLFLHQRIAHLGVVMVCTSRPDSSALDGWPAPAVDVEALSGDDARTLLRRCRPGLDPSASDRVVAVAAGNPLALAELPGHLGYEHPSGTAPLPGRLPIGQRLESHFARRLRELPVEAAELLLRVALDGPGMEPGDAHGGGVGFRPWAAEAAGSGVAEGLCTEPLLARIESSGLARLDGMGRLVFRHPLVRTAVVSSASDGDRRTAHRALARRLHPEDTRRLLHEAAAAEGPDEALAVRLQESGARIARRGGEAEGALLLERAARLSADPPSCARRLTWAAVMSARGGRLANAAALVAEVGRGVVPDDVAPLFAYAVVYVDQSCHLDFASSFTLLPGALATLVRTEAESPAGAVPRTASGAARFGEPGELMEQMVFKLLLASAYTGDPRGWETLARYRQQVSPEARLCERAWADPPRTAHGAEAELRDLVARVAEAPGTSGSAWLLLWAGTAVDAADAELWPLFSGEHAYATQGSVTKARCYQAFLKGIWAGAQEWLREAETAEELGYHCNALLFRHYHAHFLAGRGDEEGLRATREHIGPAAAKARMRFVTDQLDRLEALAALAHGRHEEAYELLRVLMPPGELPRGQAWFHLPFFDFVEASTGCGRRAEAQAHVAAGKAAAMDRISAHHAFLLAAAEAMVADDDRAEAAFAAAYALPGSCQWIFDLARLRLAHGTWLERQGRYEEARTPLETARRTFEELEAGPWADRCTVALSRMKVRALPEVLTAQESRIAHLVAVGATNKEAGAALGLSPRTVAAHLYRIFPKLGITSRAALARALPEV